MHALGNDFIVVEAAELPRAGPLDELARRACERGTGVGADGLLIVGPRLAERVWQLRIFNADGSHASACGNGARCAARYLLADDGASAVLRTDAEDVWVAWDGRVATVRLRAPRLGRRHIVPLAPGDTGVRLVGARNRHAVVLGLRPEDVDLGDVARIVRGRFGDVNVEVVALDGPNALRLRVDEGGVGETLACGTGACAAVAAARVEGWVGDDVVVRLPGGELGVSLEGDAIVLRGPASESFRGEWAA